MVINTNMSAETAATNLQHSQSMLAKSLARLSSGSKLTSPADDAAGTAVSTRMESQVNRLKAAESNVANAVSFTQTQDGFLQKIGGALDRMSELSISSQDATKTDADRALYDKEFQTLAAYVTSASNKDFNGVSLFDGASLNLTIDSEGNSFAMAGIDLQTTSYTTALSASVDTAMAVRAWFMTSLLDEGPVRSPDHASTLGLPVSGLEYAVSRMARNAATA